MIDDRLTRQLRHIVDANVKTAAVRAAATVAEKPPGDQWWHADQIDEDDELDADPVIEPGIPESLAEALADWVDEDATDEELTALIGPVPGRGKGS